MRVRGVVVLASLALVAGACGKEQPKEAAAAPTPAGPAPGTPEWKIQDATSAAPASIGANATVMDWPSTPDGTPAQLRAGSNGWTCFTDMPGSPGNDPMCFDEQFGVWATAWMSHKKPQVTKVGIAYMLRGGSDASNTDPFKMKPDAGEPWVDTGPHIMVIDPNPNALNGLSTDWKSGGPYVMFQNTPYAHVMVPVAPVSK